MENRELQRLDSFLATLDPEEPVAIGASDGSGFLFFGKAGEPEQTHAAFTAYYERKKKTLQSRKAQLFSLVTNPPRMKGNPEKDWDTVLRRANSIIDLVPTIKSVQKYLDSYAPPMERLVLDTYTKHVDGPRTAVIIEGYEHGFWTVSEAEEGKICG